MSERPSQQKQILAKLDELTEAVNGIKEDLAGIKRQPEIDAKVFQDHERRIKGLEENQRWTVLSILGLVIASIWKLIAP